LINVNGRGRLSSINALTLSATSLGNMGFHGVDLFNVSSNSTYSSAILDIPGWSLVVGPSTKGMSASMASLVYALCDLAACLVFFICYTWLRPGEIREERQVNAATITADDYTLYLPRVDPYTTEASLRGHFAGLALQAPHPPGTPADFWEVEEVHVVEDDAGLVAVCVARGRLSRKMDRTREKLLNAEEEEKSQGGSSSLCCPSWGRAWRISSLRALLARQEGEYKVLDRKARESGSSNWSVAAFVTFKYMEARDWMAGEYKGSEGCVGWLCQPRYLRLRTPSFLKESQHQGKSNVEVGGGLRRVTVKPAPSPSSVMWENLHITSAERCLRTTITGNITVGLLGLSFLLLWFASWKTTQVQNTSQLSSCASVATLPLLPNSPSMSFYHSMVAEAVNETKYCTCATMPWSSYSYSQLAAPYKSTGLLDASDCPFQSCPRWLVLDATGVWSQSFCVFWLYNRASAALLVVSAAVLVLFVNVLLAWFMRLLTKVEGHHSYEDLNASLALRLFYASFINTGLLVVVINIAWPFVVAYSEFKTGKYNDFTVAWYDNVGTSLLVTMLINIFSAHIYYVLCGCLFCRHSRKADASRFITQRDLNKSLMGPFSDPSVRISQLFNTIFVCFTFSTGLPLMIPVAASSVFLFYWVDKTLFMWYFRKPPHYSIKLQQTMSALLPGALLLHLGVGIWMLTASGGFSISGSVVGTAVTAYIDPIAAQVSSLSQDSSFSVGISRVSNSGILPLFVFFLFIAAWLLLWGLFSVLGFMATHLFDFLTCYRCRGKHDRRGGFIGGAAQTWRLDTPTFSDSRRSHNRHTPRGMKGTPSYNILLNPEIMWTFNIPLEFALKHHKRETNRPYTQPAV